MLEGLVYLHTHAHTLTPPLGCARDWQPMPPPFKLVREMVDAMGGQQSSHYR